MLAYRKPVGVLVRGGLPPSVGGAGDGGRQSEASVGRGFGASTRSDAVASADLSNNNDKNGLEELTEVTRGRQTDQLPSGWLKDPFRWSPLCHTCTGGLIGVPLGAASRLQDWVKGFV